jgi:pyridoxine 4-dehydrogenase
MLAGLTWRQDPPSQSQSFEAMRTALSLGANNWNGGEIYGSPERNSLHLLNEYFTKYPEDAEKVVLSIKGGIVPGQMKPDGSKEGVRRSIDECLRVLDGKKFLDLFECGKCACAPMCESYKLSVALQPVWISMYPSRRQLATSQSMSRLAS